MALGERRANVRLKLLAAILIMIWSSSIQGTFFCATAMTIDEAISAAAADAASVKGRSSMPMQSDSQSDLVTVELDMRVPKNYLDVMKRAGERGIGRRRRSALRTETYRWPNATIPYKLTLELTDEETKSFNAALEDYHQFTCLRFRHATNTDKAYVNIVSAIGCWSYVGLWNSSAPQNLSLSAGCRDKNTIIHELAHAIGIQHEQTRPDRDAFVKILDENIQPGMHHNFDKYNTDYVDTRGIPYDYLSVMHYGELFFSKNKKTTIETKNGYYQKLIGNAPGFSFRDVKLINSIYSCSGKNRCRKKTCPLDGFVGQDCQCWCPSGSTEIAAVKCQGCQDYNEFCHTFMMRGMCTRRLFANYMKDVCPRTCGICAS